MFKIFNMSHFDHIQIRDQLDRDQTAALLAALADPTTCAADADEIARSLDMLADPRATGATLSILRDRALPSERRDLAGTPIRRCERRRRIRCSWMRRPRQSSP